LSFKNLFNQSSISGLYSRRNVLFILKRRGP